MRVFLAIIISATASWNAVRADDPREEPATITDDVQDLIFLSPEHPLFIRLHIQVDGKSFRDLPDVLAERLFAVLDDNGDQMLDAMEAKRIPPRDRFRSVSQATPVNFHEIDENRDGSIDEKELREFVRQSVGNPLSLQRGTERRTVDVDLFSQFDIDRDGILTPQEIRRSRVQLSKRDIDDDETFSAVELQPPAEGASGGESTAIGMLLIALDNSRWQSDVAYKLLRFYDRDSQKNAKSGGGLRLNREELGVDDPLFTQLDKNGDGELGLAELTPLVQQPVPQVELIIQLQTKGRSRLKIDVLKQPESVTISPGRRGRLTMSVAGIEILLEAARQTVTAYDDRQLFKIRFFRSDTDKNQYLDRNEFTGLELSGAQFEMVDRDRDDKVVMDEVTEYVNRQAALTRNQARLTVAKDGKSLFEILDVNIDRRLGPREFDTASTQLAEWDRNGDGRLALTEIPNKYKLTFSVGRSLVFSQAVAAPNRPMQAQRPPADTSAPLWFQKMDRNRDGDVSKREFLGPLKAFRKLDRDGDGLLDSDEANASEKNDENQQ